MRSVDPAALVQALAGIIKDQVIPTQVDGPSRSTLWMIVGLLDNVSQRIKEDPDVVEFENAIFSGLLEVAPQIRSRPVVGTGKRDLSEIFRTIAADRVLLDSPDVREWLDRAEGDLRRLVERRASMSRPTRYMRALDP